MDGLALHRIAAAGLWDSFQITSVLARMSVLKNLRIGVLARHRRHYAAWRSARSLRTVNDETAELLETVGLGHRYGDAAAALAHSEPGALELGNTLRVPPSATLLGEPTAGQSAAR